MTLLSAFAVTVASLSLSVDPTTQPFEMLNISCGGYGNPPSYSFAERLSSSNNRIYQHPIGGNYPPVPEDIAAFQFLEYDSYIAIGGSPSSLLSAAIEPNSVFCGKYDGHFAPRYYLLINNSDWSQPLSHDWFAPFPFGGAHAISAPGPGGNQAVFLARITVDRGQVPVAPKMYLGIIDPANGRAAGYFSVLDGPSIYQDPYLANRSVPPSVWIRLKSYLAAQVDLPEFGPADVYDIYAESVPEYDSPWVADASNPADAADVGQPGEPNDVPAEAVTLTDEVSLQTLNDVNDYFYYVTNYRGRFTFELTFANPEARAEVTLISRAGSVMDREVAELGTARVAGGGNPGTYLLSVRRVAGNGHYSITPSFAADAANDTDGDGVTTPADVLNILAAWGQFLPIQGQGSINPDLNNDDKVGRPDLEIILRTQGYNRSEHTPKSWKQAMGAFYASSLQPIENFPAGATRRQIARWRKEFQRYLQSAQP